MAKTNHPIKILAASTLRSFLGTNLFAFLRRTLFFRRLTACLILIFFFFSNIATAFDGQVTEGNATITTEGNTTTIQADSRAVIEGNMSIAENEIVRVIQGSNDLLLRDISGMRTDWLGSMIADGRIVLVNTHGVFIASAANIDVKSLIASTLDIQNTKFLQNQLRFEKVEGIDAAKILNEANITVKEGQSLVFLAEAIENRGNITAYLGTVAMGVGTKTTLSFDPSGMVNLVVEEGIVAPETDAEGNVVPSILNSGTITANGGKVQLSAKTMNATFDQLINNTGVIEAGFAVERDGIVEFVSTGAIVNEGTLKASAVEERGSTYRSTGTMEVGSMLMDNLDGAADISGSISGTYNDTGDIRLTGNVTLTGTTTLRADSDNDSVGKLNMQTYTITGGANNLTLYSGENVTLNSITTTGTVTINASTGAPTYTVGNNTTWGALTLNSGIFEMNGKTLTLSGGYTQTGGTFNGSTNSMTVGGFNLSGGVFNAPAATLLLSGVIGASFVRSGSGVFNAGTGTVQINGNQVSSTLNTPGDVFNNLYLNYLTTLSGRTIDVLGTLTIGNAINSGTINAKGTVTGNSTSASGSVVVNVANDSNTAQDISFNGGTTPVIVINNPNATVTLNANTVFNSLTLNNGSFNGNGFNTTVTNAYSQGGGTFTGGTGTKTFSSTFSQSGGTFNGGSGTLDFNNDVSISGGTFNSTSGNLLLGRNLTISGTGIFNHNNGTVIYDAGGSYTLDVLSSLTFNNLEMNPTSGSFMGIGSGDTIVVNGALTLTNGQLYSAGVGTLNAKGSVSIASTFDGNWSSGNGVLLIDGAGDQSFTVPSGAVMPRLILNNSLTTITFTSGANTSWTGQADSLVLQAGVINANGANLTLNGFTQSGGVFNGGSGTLDFNNASVISGGTFNSTSGSMYAGHNLTISGTGVFNHNNGTLIFDGNGSYTLDVLGSLNLNNFGINMVTAGQFFGVGSSDTVVVNGALTLTNGVLYSASNGVLNAKGSISIASTFDGSWSSGNGVLLIDGAGDQSFTVPSGAVMPRMILNNASTTITFTSGASTSWNGQANSLVLQAGTINANGANLSLVGYSQSGGTFNGSTGSFSNSNTHAISGGTFNSASGTLTQSGATTISGGTYNLNNNITIATLTVSGGTLDINGKNLTSTTFNLNGTGTFKLQGGETVSTPTIGSGGTVLYYGTSGTPYTMKNWAYKNLVIAGGASAVFNLGASIASGQSITLTSGNTTGALTANGFDITLSGNWTNNIGANAFTAGSRTVTLNGTNQTISGSTTFNHLTKTVAATDTLTFQAGSTQTVAGTLTLNGAAGQPLTLMSSTPGSQWSINPQGTRTLSYIDVMDSNNTNASAISAGTGFINGGNNTNWGFSPANFTWIGLGSTNNWSEGANWQGGVAPGSGNIAIFSGDSLKAATVDTNLTIGGIYISPGYSGTITQNSNVTFNGSNGYIQKNGTFNVASYTFTTPNVNNLNTYNLHGGTFNGDTGTVHIGGNFTISGGTFNAPLHLYFNGATGGLIQYITHAAGGAFNAGSGTTYLTGGGGVRYFNMGNDAFNHFTINCGTSFGCVDFSGTNAAVDGNFNYNFGRMINGTLNLKGAQVNFQNTGNSGDTTVLWVNGTGAQAVSINGGYLPYVRINNANATIDYNASTTFRELRLDQFSGTFDLDGYDLTITPQAGNTAGSPVGAFSMGSGAGTFTGGTGTMTVDGHFTISGGTFNAPDNLIFSGGRAGNTQYITHTAGGTINYGSGTIHLTGGGGIQSIDMGSDVMGNVTINSFATGLYIGSSLTVGGTLNLSNAQLLSGTINAQGTTNFNSGYDGGVGTVRVNGGLGQAVNFNGGVTPNVIINNSNASISYSNATTFTSLNLQNGTLNIGDLNMTVSGAYTQSGGIFTGGAGNMSMSGAFTLSGGTFNAADTMTWNNGSSFTHTAGGTFNAGTNFNVSMFGASGFTMNAPNDVFNNLSVNTGNQGMTLSGGPITVNGALTLTNSYLSTGTVNAKGAVNFTGSGNTDSTGTINVNGTSPQTLTFNGGGTNIMPALTINNPQATVVYNGATSFRSLNLQSFSGSFDLNGYSMNVGYGGALGGGTFTQSSGTFNGGSGQVTLSGAFTLSGGTFNAPGTFVMANGASFTHTAGGTYNTGTNFLISIFGATSFTMNAPNETFNNFTVNLSGGTATALSNNTITVNGTLTLTDGQINSGTVNAKGNVSVASTFDRGNANYIIGGNGAQTLSGTGLGTSFTSGTVTVNNADGSFNLGGSTTITNLTVASGGTLNLNGNNLTSTTLNVNGILKLVGDETVSTPTLNSGSTVEYSATSGTRAIKNWIYTNSTVKINGLGGTFTLPANLTAANLNINAGTLDQGTYNIVTGAAGGVTVGSQGIWSNTSTGDVTLGSAGVVNNGYIRFDGSGLGGGGADAILIRSTTDGAQRDWTGSGFFSIVDVDVKDQAGTSTITAYSSTDSLNNGANWTITALNPTSKTWTGAVSNVWSLGANWLEGSAPTGSETAIFNPFSSVSANFDGAAVDPLSVQVVTGYNGTITLQKNLSVDNYSQWSGTFDANGFGTSFISLVSLAGGTYEAGSGTHLFDGGLTVSGGTLNAGSAILDIGGEMTLSGGVLNAGSSTIQASEGWDARGGTFNAGTGAVDFDGGAGITRQVWTAGHAFNDVSFNDNLATWAVNDDLTASGDLTITAGTLHADGNVSVGGTFTNNALLRTSGTGANLSISQNNLGNVTFTNNASGLLAKTYGTLTLQNGGTSQGDVIAGTLNLNAGTLDIGGNNLTINSAINNSGVISTSGDGSNLTLPAGNVGSFTFSNTASNLLGRTYNTLTLASGGTAQGGVTAGTLNMNAGTLAMGANNLTVNTTLSNSGLITVSSGTITIPNAAAGNFNYTANNTIARATYNTLTLGNGGTAQGNISATDLNLSAGTFNVGGNNLTVSNALSNSGVISTSGTGANLSLNGTNMGNMTFTSNASSLAAKTYGTLILQNGGTTQGDVAAANLTLNAGTLNVGGNNLTVSNTLSNSGTISTSGTGANLSLNGTNMGNVTFTVNASQLAAKTYGILTLQNGGTSQGNVIAGTLNLNAGTLDIGGNNLTINSAINNSGVISTSGNGSNLILPTGDVGSFTFSSTASNLLGRTYNTLTLASGGTAQGNVAASTLNMNGSTLAMGANNLTVSSTLSNSGLITVSSGAITIPNAAAGNFNYTASNNIAAATYGTLTLENGGTAQGNITATDLNLNAGTFNVGGNNLNVSGTLTNNGTIQTSGNGSNLTITQSSLGNVTFTANASQLAAKTYGTLTLQNGGTALGNITSGNIVIGGGTMAMGANTLNVAGNFSNSGTFTSDGTVVFDGAVAGKTITMNSSHFENVTFNGNGGWTLTDSASVDGNFNLMNGAVVQAGNLNIAGDYIQTGGSLTDLTPLAHSFSVDGNFSVSYDSDFNRYTGGGTLLNPYVIHDIFDLQAMKTHLGSHFKLNAHLDASVADGWNSGAGFSPIGDATHIFTGSLDGNEKVIADLTINNTGADYLGLFGNIGTAGAVHDLGLEEVSVYGNDHVGGLAGFSAGLLQRVFTTGVYTVSGNQFVGGLTGENTGTITDAYSSARVVGNGKVGGLIGQNSGNVARTYSIGHVSGNTATGGLLGANSGVVTHSYWDQDMSGQMTSAGGTGLETDQMMMLGTYAGWDMAPDTGVWVMDDGASYAHFRWRFESGLRGIWGYVFSDENGFNPIGPGIEIELLRQTSELDSGTALGTTKTGASGMFYFVLGQNDLQDTDLVSGRIINHALTGRSTIDAGPGSITDFDVWGSMIRRLTRLRIQILPEPIFQKEQPIKELFAAGQFAGSGWQGLFTRPSFASADVFISDDAWLSDWTPKTNEKRRDLPEISFLSAPAAGKEAGI